MKSAPVCGNVDCKKPWLGFFHQPTVLACSLQIQDSNNADVLLDSGLKLSNIIVILCSKLLDYILLKSGYISGLCCT